uniref:Leucine-zipper-like transcriptional regulator 1 n=1 Tax=Lygus hesperus TaxID=30085 RepID=A0A146LGW2_LYGHE
MMWSPVTPKNDATEKTPTARSKHSVTLHGDHLFLFAGRNGNIPLKDLWRYSLSDGVWQQLEPTGDRPPNLQEHTAVAFRDSIYVFGGEVGFSACNEAPLWIYNTKTNAWRKVKGGKGVTVPKGRRGHSALVHRATMVIYGGYRDLKGSCNELWVFHFETESWHLLSNGKVFPPARHKHSMVIHDSSIWVYGGMTDLQERSDLWRFDTLRRIWHPVKSKVSPGPLHSHATCKLPSSMLIFGGERDGQPNNELWRFHFGTETWEKLALEGIPPQPRSESVALTVPELLLQNNSCVSKSSPKRFRGGGSIDRQNGRPKSSTGHRGGTPSSSNLSILKEISKFSQMNLTRLGQNNAKCSYSMLSSTESISETSLMTEMVKSQSHHIIAKSVTSPSTAPQSTLPRDPVSVPNFASLASCTLTPVEVTKLVYLDDEQAPETVKQDFFSIHQQFQPKLKRGIPKSASVRFGNPIAATPEENCDQTSDYASIETMNKITSCNEKNKKDKEGPYSFSNPNYMGPDIKDILNDKEYVKVLNSPPDSLLEDGMGRSSSTMEMIEMKPIPPKSLPLKSTAYNSQMGAFKDKKGRAMSATRAEKDATAFCVFIVGGKERGQVTVFKRPLSIWKLQLNSSVY